MTPPAAIPTFRVHTVDRDAIWRIVLERPDGTVTDVALVRWLIELHHPNLTRDRIARGLNGQVGRQPGRTWGWRPQVGTYRADILHNGATVGEIDWVSTIRDKPTRMTAIADALNQNCGRADPFPEPQPPRPRCVEPVMGDFNFATGEEIPEHERTAAA